MTKLTKHRRNAELGESRKNQAPKKGSKVEYPVPLPPVGHVKRDPETGDLLNEWLRLPGIDEDGDPRPGLDGERNPLWAEQPWEEVALPSGEEQWHPALVIEL